MRRLFTRFHREERGAVMVIAAAAIVAMLAMAAFAIDIGSWYQVQRQAQSASDAAALAGAQDLPTSQSQAITDATAYVSKNMRGATATITFPSSSQIKVVVSITSPSFFGKLLGVTSANVSATAVAQENPLTSPSAMFSNDSTCGDQAIAIPGSGITVVGGTHTNGTLVIPGSNNNLGSTTYGGPNGCSATINGSGNTFGGASAPVVDPTLEAWPFDPRANLPACTYSAASFSWSNNAIVNPGVYCATSQIQVPGSNLTGTVTFIAPKISMSGSNNNFTPYWQSLLIYQSGTNDLNIAGSDLHGGTIFAPNAKVALSGSGGVVTGFIEAAKISVSGSNWTFTGDGPSLAGATNSLIQ